MTAEQILSVYFVVFALQLLTELSLDILNVRHVLKHRGEVPDVFRGQIEEAGFNRSIEYTVAKAKLGTISTLVSSTVVLVFVISGLFGAVDRAVRSWELPGHLEGVAYVSVISLLFGFVSIPFNLYGTFVLEERFGFNKMTFRLWLSDLMKEVGLSAVLGGILLYGVLWFMEATGPAWWIYVFCFVGAFQLLLLYLYPVLISPLFNKFQPLGEGDLKNAITNLAERVKLKTSGIFVMDGSKRSGHGNAYFTGFGKNKRIVLFDTLINNLSANETLAVLAHEIGHEKKNHIKKTIVLSFLTMAMALFILSRLAQYAPLFEAFGFERVTNHGALVIFTFASGPFTYFLSPLFSILSRKHEYEADRFAVDAVKNYHSLAGALVGLSKKSLSNLVPHPLYSFFHYSHPTLVERVKAMREYAEGTYGT